MRLVPCPPLFRDRVAAGRVLSEAVAALQLDQPVVVGVARGGVAVALEVARELEAPLTAIDVERVNAYGLRLGAVTAHGPPYLRGGTARRKRTSSRRSREHLVPVGAENSVSLQVSSFAGRDQGSGARDVCAAAD
jgi:phosphoribosylpyrophosphate synthetase